MSLFFAMCHFFVVVQLPACVDVLQDDKNYGFLIGPHLMGLHSHALPMKSDLTVATTLMPQNDLRSHRERLLTRAKDVASWQNKVNVCVVNKCYATH